MSTNKKYDDDNLIYSDELVNLFGRTPSWILRWGNAMFLLFILAFVAISFIIRYPEVIKSRIVITTPLPPVSIVALNSGQIDKLFVKDLQQVSEGEVLAILKSPVKYEDIQCIKKLLSSDTIPSSIRQSYQIGNLQYDYNSYIRAYRDYNQFIKLNSYETKIAKMEGNLSYYQSLLNQINIQMNISHNEFGIIASQYAADSILYADGNTISKRELNASRLNFLAKNAEYENNKQNLLRTEIQHNELNHLIAELKVNYENEYKQLQNTLNSAKKQLESSINIWESNHVLKASIAGKVSFFSFWSENQFVKAGDEVFTIVPKMKQSIIGKIIMPTANSGKVSIGQKVLVRLDGFPYKEYGLIKGTVTNISLVPKNQTYAAEVSFKEGLKTTYKKEIQLNQEMAGDAEIITKDLRLIQRIMYQFKDIFYNKTAS